MKKYLLISIIIAGNLFAQTNSESNDFSYPLKLYNQSFYDLAAQQFVQFYNNHPASSKVPEAKYYAGMSYYKQGKFNQARIEFQSAAIEHPGSNRAGECWFKTGDCYVKLDEKEEAAKAYETIRLLYPENPLAPEGLYKAGILYAQIDKNDKAMQLLRVIMDRYNTSEQYFPAMVQMAQSFYKTDELQKANDLLEKVLNSTTDKAPLAEAYLLKAKISQSQGDFNSAKNYYQTIIDKYPQSDYFSQASIALSELLIYEGQFNQAKDIITTAISREKDKIRQNYMHGLLGDIYFLDAKYALAIKEYDADTGNEGKSGLPLIPVKEAIAKYKQNYVSDAAQELSVLLDNKTNFDEKTYDLLFEVYIKWLAKAGKKQQAINALFNHINGLKSQQNKVKFSAALAELLRQQGQWREIVQLLQPYLFVSESYPEMDDIIYYLGLANEQLGEYKQSAHFYRRLINEFGASVYYDKASEHLEYLNSYKIVDIDQTVLQMANILGKSLDEQVPSTELLLEHARMYYDKLKNYEGAKIQLQAILQKNPDKPGDVYLLLGKTYLKLAEKDPDGSAESRTNVKKANENFKLAVANIESCSRPDEASWMRIDAGLSIDTLGVAREKTLIEALINKYPNSPLMEEWFRTLAYSLSFNESYFETAESYFKQLISKYKSSDYYPSYLYAYAQLINDKNDEDAQKIYKQIASGYSKSSVAANALVHVAEDYRMKNMYNEAYTLYKKLIDTYYYANIAQENINKLAMTALKAGNYDAVIDIVGDKIYPEFAMDIVISKELLGKDIENYIYLLAKANEGKSNPKIALDYLQQYLNIAIAGIYVNDARFDIGKIFFNQNQKGMALENFKLISPKDKDLYRQARLYMGEIYFQLGDFKQAASIYSEISDLIKDPAVLVKVKAQRIVSLIRLGNFKEANSLIGQFKKEYSNQKNYLAQFEIEQGDYLRLKKEYSKARKKYEQVKNKYKSTDYIDDAEYNIALIHLTLNENDKAFTILSNFYKNYSGSDKLPAALNSLGTLYYRSEKYDNAISMFKNALASCKDAELERSILSNLIQTYTMTSFWDAAQGTARQYVEKFPEAPDNLDKKIIIAQAYINLNQFERAIEYLRQIKFEADSEREPEVQYYIGEAYLKAGQYENAIAEFVKIPLLSKKTKLQWEASALYYSGQSYEKLGRIDDAVRMYQEIINRPGIDLVLKKEAEKRIQQIQ